jgi:hypothetical protein
MKTHKEFRTAGNTFNNIWLNLQHNVLNQLSFTGIIRIKM